MLTLQRRRGPPAGAGPHRRRQARAGGPGATLLALKNGEVLTEKDVRAGLRRLREGSGGAFRLEGEPPYSVETLAEGVRLKVAMATVHTRLRVRVKGPISRRCATESMAFARGRRELTSFGRSALEHARVYARAAYGFSRIDVPFVLGAQRPFAGPPARRRLRIPRPH